MPSLRGKGARMSDERLTIDEFCERLKVMLSDPASCKCPRCGGQIIVSHGLAGGGAGPYVSCLACDEIVLKALDDTGAPP